MDKRFVIRTCQKYLEYSESGSLQRKMLASRLSRRTDTLWACGNNRSQAFITILYHLNAREKIF